MLAPAAKDAARATAAQTAGAPAPTNDVPNDVPGEDPRGPTRAPAPVPMSRPAATPGSAPTEAPGWVDESPEQRDARHQAIDQRITETLGDIPADKRAALMALNDEAIQVQRNLRVELMQGTITDADMQDQLHQAMLVQLDEMHDLLTDDEYRKMTGLEPGVDPYEYQKTGVGAAAPPK
jgi:hypothetical protein